MTSRPLTPSGFDRAMAEARQPAPKVLWTAARIGERIGRSADFVRDRLAKEPGSPVKMVGGQWCVLEDELLAYFRPQAA